MSYGPGNRAVGLGEDAVTTSVTCGVCGRGWPLAGGWSVYAREAIESRPCPSCGAYTLKSPEPKPPQRARRKPDLRQSLRAKPA